MIVIPSWTRRFGLAMGALLMYTPSASVAQAAPQFEVSGFVVVVAPETVRVQGTSETWMRSGLPAPGVEFSGKGQTNVGGVSVPVTFSKVRVRDAAGSLVATAGTVTGAAGKNKEIRYAKGQFQISFPRQSLTIRPDSARADVKVGIPASAFSGGSSEVTLFQKACSIASNGGVSGNAFSGSATIPLKRTVYVLGVAPEDPQSVQLMIGAPAAGTPPPGVRLQGKARRENVPVFTYELEMAPHADVVDLVMTAIQEFKSKPELDHSLIVHSGRVKCRYEPGAAAFCDGALRVSLKLPSVIEAEDGGRIELLGVELRTDGSGAMFGPVAIPKLMKAGFRASGTPRPLILLESSLAQVYLPVWHRDNDSLGLVGKKPTSTSCAEILQTLGAGQEGTGAVPANAGRRPGLTLMQGTLFLAAPQANVPPTAARGRYTLKIPFWGALTSTVWGIVGEVGSSSQSFIPAGGNLKDAGVPVAVPRPTWQEIVDAGNSRPADPAERFRLAGLRILNMQVGHLRLCLNQLASSSVRYDVHFPYPTFVDLSFEDVSLDADGFFHAALGPIAPRAFPANLQLAQEVASHLPSPTLPRGAIPIANLLPSKPVVVSYPVPEGQFFWAWHLPVTFADRGVAVSYQGVSAPDVRVRLDTSRTDARGAIESSELRVRPLFSKNSALGFGLRFAGLIHADGELTVDAWDQTPAFELIYAQPGTELVSGFDTREVVLTLAPPGTLPSGNEVPNAEWKGQLQFPFFGWTDVQFAVKDLEPKHLAPTVLAGSGAGTCCADVAGAGATEYEFRGGAACPDARLDVGVTELHFAHQGLRFWSDHVTARENGVDISPESMEMTAFTRGAVRKRSDALREAYIDPPPIELNYQSIPDACGRPLGKKARQFLADAVSSSNMNDLVCYDSTAVRARNIPGACCQEFLVGTYKYMTKEEGGAERTLVSAPNTRLYRSVTPPRLELHGDMTMKSDEGNESHPHVIGIPGAQLAYDGRFIRGEFGATMATIARALPYEGELKFLLNKECGDFYVVTAGSFTYGLRFSGTMFLVHAPYGKVKQPPTIPNVTDPMKDMAYRAFFPDTTLYERFVGLDGVAPTTLVTGLLTGGNVSAGYSFGPVGVNVAAGSSLYFYQLTPSGGQIVYKAGTFVNAYASASLVAEVKTTTQLATSATAAPATLTDFEALFDHGDFEAKGALTLSGCASALVAHCEVGLVGEARISAKGRLSVDGSGACAHCDTGGCGGCH
jgi:hypothetical protein